MKYFKANSPSLAGSEALQALQVICGLSVGPTWLLIS
jgi:hypothetical protein